MNDTIFVQGRLYRKSDIDTSIQRATRNQQAEWNEVMEALVELYENWARLGVENPQTLGHLDKLMNTYDSWLG